MAAPASEPSGAGDAALEARLTLAEDELLATRSELERARRQLSIAESAFARLVADKGVTEDGKLALLGRAHFEDMLRRHPLNAAPSFHRVLFGSAISSVLKAMADEGSRACLCCSALEGKHLYSEKREILVAIGRLQPESGDESYDESETWHDGWRAEDEHVLMRLVGCSWLVGCRWEPFHRLLVRDPTHLIASTHGIIAFSPTLYHPGRPGVCLAGHTWGGLAAYERLTDPGGSACCIPGGILLCGGGRGPGDLQQAWLDGAGPRRLPQMSRGRCLHSCATMGGLAYVVGGFSCHGDPLASVDVYDPKTDTWELMRHKMRHPRSQCGVVGTRGRLFALAGRLRGQGGGVLLRSCEYWDTNSGRGWLPLADAPAGGRCSAAACDVVRGAPFISIYAVFEESTSLWRYTHRADDTGEWLDCSFMKLPRGVTDIRALCVAPEVAQWDCFTGGLEYFESSGDERDESAGV